MPSPMELSLAKLRKEGYTVTKTEHWNPFARRRIDMFGFADILAFNEKSIVLVQTTTSDHVSERIMKIRESCHFENWLKEASRKIVVHGWGKQGPRGKKKLWTCREVELNSNFGWQP